MSDPDAPPRSARVLLALAALAVAFAAADTYVVVLALPEMMRASGLSIEELQRAAPIVSGFLLGYVAMLPLIGRIADLRGRLPVLVGSLVVFAIGSLVTAAAYDLPSLVVGRFLQGAGGGGLVPVTLALVADLYPPRRRGVPLGVVGAVQELGSVAGPLYGALVLQVSGWRAIFWVNLVVGLVLAAAIAARGGPTDRTVRASGALARRDLVGMALAALTLAGGLLVMLQPRTLVTSVAWGGPFVPFALDGSRWLSPLGLVTATAAALLVLRLVTARRPLVDLRGWWRSARDADLPGALLLAVALGGIILAFATADPEVEVMAEAGPWYLAATAVAAGAFWWQQRHARAPLLPRGAFAARPAWGALVVSLFVGAALIAALVDVPVFARVTVYGDSQIRAALVLVELLAALPVGALLGGLLVRRLPASLVAAGGMLIAAGGNVAMSRWEADALSSPLSAVVLAGTGLGFGLALAPVNAALLAHTPAAVHGVASAFLVVARMIGMLVGISALTTIGLRRLYAVQADLPPPAEVCGDSTSCPAYLDLVEQAGVAQLQAIFTGAAVCAAIAALAALLLSSRSSARSSAEPSAQPSARRG